MIFLLSLVSYVIIVIFGYSLIKLIVKNFVRNYYVHKLPGPPGSLIFGNIRPVMDTPDKIFQIVNKWSRQYYPVYKLWLGPVSCVSMTSPEDIAIILGNLTHSKKGLTHNTLTRWLRTGLLNSFGVKWSQRRKILTPAFHFNILKDFIHIFNDKSKELVDVLKKEVEKPYTEVNDLITESALKIIGETAMGVKMDFIGDKGKNYVRALHDLGNIMVHRTVRPYLLFDTFYTFTPTFFKELKLVKILHEFTKEVIAKKEKEFSSSKTSQKKRLALFDLLLTAKKEQGIIDDEGIREEVDTFMFEGHDTISTAIKFALMLLACHPQIQEEIVDEMRHVLGDIKKAPDYAELQNLTFMDRCIKEILRMYPPVYFINRLSTEDFVTSSGYKMKKDTWVFVHIYSLHHNPEIYPDPEKFDPDRFLPENCKGRHPFAYIPFSAGPRNCIGQKFAMLEMKAVFCAILGNFVLEPVDTPKTVTLIVDVILRTKEHIKVKFLPRVE